MKLKQIDDEYLHAFETRVMFRVEMTCVMIRTKKQIMCFATSFYHELDTFLEICICYSPII